MQVMHLLVACQNVFMQVTINVKSPLLEHFPHFFFSLSASLYFISLFCYSSCPPLSPCSWAPLLSYSSISSFISCSLCILIIFGFYPDIIHMKLGPLLIPSDESVKYVWPCVEGQHQRNKMNGCLLFILLLRWALSCMHIQNACLHLHSELNAETGRGLFTHILPPYFSLFKHTLSHHLSVTAKLFPHSESRLF